MEFFKKINYILFLFFLLKFNSNAISEYYYPDHFLENDEPFNSAYNKQDSNANVQKIYSLGYYAKSGTTKNIYSNKFGIYYEPDVSCDGTFSSNETFPLNEIMSNYFFNKKISEEKKLLLHTVKGNNIECLFPIRYISSNYYIVLFKLPFYLSGASTFNIKVGTSGNYQTILNYQSTEAIGNYVTFTLTISTGNSGNKIFTFTNNLDSTKTQINVLSTDKLYIKYESNTADLYLSHYRVTFTDTASKIGMEIAGTKNAGYNAEDDNDCIYGYHKIPPGTCEKCDDKCSKCSNRDTCTQCNRLTSPFNKEDIGKCEINYVNLAMFDDLSIKFSNVLDNNRVTLGFWVMIPNLLEAKSNDGAANMFHVVVTDFVVASIAISTNSVSVYCTPHENLNKRIKTYSDVASISLDTADTIIKSVPSSSQITAMNNKSDLNGQWFHITCASSYDHGAFYLNTIINNVEDYESKVLPFETLYKKGNIKNDHYFRKIYRSGDESTLEIRQMSYLGDTTVFLKNIIVFKEYMDHNLRFMYFNFKEKTSVFKEIALLVPLDNLIKDGSSYIIKSKSLAQENDINLTLKNTYNIEPPLNFKHLTLLNPNKFYKTSDLDIDSSNITTLSENANVDFFYKEDAPLRCKEYMQHTKVDSIRQCDSQCDDGYMNYPDSGYCDHICSIAMKCDSDNYDDFCVTGGDYYNLYYECVDKSNDYYMQYSHFYSPGKIEIPISELKSYIIEFWYYPDFFLQQTDGALYSYGTSLWYIFYSNIVQLGYNTGQLHYYTSFGGISNSPITSLYNDHEWNKFIIYSLFNNDTNIYSLSLYINNYFNDPISLGNTTVESNLKKIVFCDGCSQPQGIVYWATGYYKDLKVWNGEKAYILQTVQFDQIYSAYKSNRINSIVCFFPLKSNYIKENKITDPKDGDIVEIEGKTSEFKLQLINYGINFDYIAKAFPSLGKTLVNGDKDITELDCPIGCSRCFDSSACYACKTGYFLQKQSCYVIKNYYFKSPPENPDGASEATVNVNYSFDTYPAITCAFWIKLFGFNEEETGEENTGSDVIYYSDNLFLHYNYNDGMEDFGLSLKYGVSKFLVSVNKNFREKFGKWVFISLSYHTSQKLGSDEYFPKMMKFEIDVESFEIKYENLTGEVSFDQFKIPLSTFCLIYKLRYYNTYIVGLYGYETSKATLSSPFSYPTIYGSIYFSEGDTDSNCYTSLVEGGDKYKCQPDYDAVWETLATTTSSCIVPYNNLYETRYCSRDCMNTCYNNETTTCSCLIKNGNSQFFLRNKDMHICKKFDYINFAKAKDIKIENILTAKETKKYTMQFWMFAYNYINDKFKGITFLWNGHNKIVIEKGDSSTNNVYNITCYTYVVADENGNEIEISQSITDHITINKWNFISCAVNYNELRIYLNINETPKQANIETVDYNDIISKETYTYLLIKDNSPSDLLEWGVLFYRQIHLWKEAYFNSEFLSRIDIKTKSLFPYLLHTWEPEFIIYSNRDYYDNFIVSDRAGIASDFRVENQGGLGANIVDNDGTPYPYNEIKLCSENGQYYDADTDSCLQFTDVSKMADFSFPNVPVSYSGAYTMGFWIFLEDSSTITNGIHFRWEKHLQITVIKNTELEGYCFPQGYYSDNIPNNPINTKYASVLNRNRVNLVNSAQQSDSGNWIYVTCAVSNYNKIYYVLGNDENAYTPTSLEPEVLYTYEEDDPVDTTSLYPLRYFYSNISNSLSQSSTLYIESITNSAKIYLRAINLFRDFIPYKYPIKYSDLSLIDGGSIMPYLAFTVNFANFNLNTKKLSYNYYVIDTSTPNNKQSYNKYQRNINLSPVNSQSTYELSANFEFMPLCNIKGNFVYNKNTKKCEGVDCTASTINAEYCYSTTKPLVCKDDMFFSIIGEDDYVCDPNCQNETYSLRGPGTAQIKGICNTEKDPYFQNGINLADYQSSIKCDGDNILIGYKCLTKTDAQNSALFFSRCYNSPNFYHSVSNTAKSKVSKGYILEFWFKKDIVLNTCGKSYTPEYYFYSTPHSLYYSGTIYYYSIIGTVYTYSLSGISEYEWNKILIETSLGTSQNVKVYINFKSVPDVNIIGIGTSITMSLTYISFCSNKNNGDCTGSGSANLNWGSAYYRNLRLWDLTQANLQVIQNYNNGMFEETPIGLILNYPLTIDTIDKNILTETISGFDNIIVTHTISKNFDSSDEYIFYNYATNFDWGATHSNKYITSITGTVISSANCHEYCKRCFSSVSTNCYECNNEYVLINQSCVKYTKYYLKTPANFEIPLNVIYDNGIESFDFTSIVDGGWTLIIYMKFMGVDIQSSSSQEYVLFNLNDNSYLYYDRTTTYLYFKVGNVIAFIDTNFGNYFGQWIPISISNYLSAYNDVYPHMLTLSVNKIDIKMQSSFSIPPEGMKIQSVKLGTSVIALWSNLYLYNNFIQGIFGQNLASESDKNYANLIHYTLSAGISAGCLADSALTGMTTGDISYKCVGDYNPYDDGSLLCNDNSKYFDVNLISGDTKPCSNCDSSCNTYCFNSQSTDCSCNLIQGLDWLRINRKTSQTYCEQIPYLDFNIIQDVSITVPTSYTLESTLEFWIFIYSYNMDQNNFEKITVRWNLHNQVEIYLNSNTIYAKCYAIADRSDLSKYPAFLTDTISGYKWVNLRCGTDLKGNSDQRTFFFNSMKSDLVITELPNRQSSTQFEIINGNSEAKNSWGFIFIKDIKLWQQDNRDYIDTSYINLHSLGRYSRNDNMTIDGKWPGLIAFFRNEFSYNINDYATESNTIVTYNIYNVLGYQGVDTTDVNYEFTYHTTLSKIRTDYKGYNYVDPDNNSYYSSLVQCEEGYVYNSNSNTCITLATTHCDLPGDTNDKCISCADSNLYINPVDGSCVAKCPIGYYPDDHLNQCRKCHDTCYTCENDDDSRFGWKSTSCTSCIDDLFLVKDRKVCINNCEEYSLTASQIHNNLCVDFEAFAYIVNVKPENDTEGIPIDVNNFNYIEAKITICSANKCYQIWEFDKEKTIELNGDPVDYAFPKDSPFTGDITKLNTTLDTTFFELDKKYVFKLNIYSIKNDEKVFDNQTYILVMNKRPFSGSLNVIPSKGLYNTTTFVISCVNWEDDTTESENLEYKFSYKEENVGTINDKNILHEWSTTNEVSSNFTVVFHTFDSSNIDIFCEIRDNYGAIREVSSKITIVNSMSSGLYSLSDALSTYSTPESMSTLEIYDRSLYLMSLGLDTYKDLQPEILQSVFEPSFDQTLITLTDPKCTKDFCNFLGDCDLVDVSLVCNCNSGYVGRNCQLDTTGYALLSKYYFELFTKLFGQLQSSIEYEQFMVVHNLYFAASQFFQSTEKSFFSSNLETYLTMAMNLYSDSIANNTAEYIDLFDYYWSFELTLLNKDRVFIKNGTGYTFRNISINENKMQEYYEAFEYIQTKLVNFLKYVVNILKLESKNFYYNSSNFYIALRLITPSFDEESFFSERKNAYKTYVNFMDCLNYYEVENLENPYYSAYLIYIEYLNFPYSFNDSMYVNNTTPLVYIGFVDNSTGKDISISGCDRNLITISFPFESYRWLNYINRQKHLFDPQNYKSPDDPIFADPIYIEMNGEVSNDTVEERIEKYHRLYNITGNYFDVKNEKFSTEGMSFLNFTSDTNYIQVQSSHLSKFTTYLIENNAEFKVNNRFFYLKRPRVFKWKGNYSNNKGFFIIGGSIGLYIILTIILSIYDYQTFKQEGLLDFLKREIVRVFLPYTDKITKEALIANLVPKFNPGINPSNKFGKEHEEQNDENLIKEENFQGLNNPEKESDDDVLNINNLEKHIHDMPNGMETAENFKIDLKGKNKKNKKNNITIHRGTEHNNFNNEKKFFDNNSVLMAEILDKKPTNQKIKNFNPLINDLEKKDKEYDVNNLPQVFENEKEEEERRIKAFYDLNLTMFEFMIENIKERHIIINPLINVSIFNPRWKKMTMLITHIATLTMMLSVFLTDDEKITGNNYGGIFKISFLAILISDVFMYFLSIFFQTSYKQRRRLYIVVIKHGQLQILKEWEHMTFVNNIWTIIGCVINYSIWIVSFYITVSFYAVWKVQNSAFLKGFLFCFLGDFILFEILIELFIALMYWKRRSSGILRFLAEKLNNVRNYRCLWP